MTSIDTAEKMARLRALGNLLFEARLAELHAAAAARASSLDRLADLERPSPANDLPELATMEIAMRYQRWADHRRAEINLSLARQTACWIEARQAARDAFSRARALDDLAKKLQRRTKR